MKLLFLSKGTNSMSINEKVAIKIIYGLKSHRFCFFIWLPCIDSVTPLTLRHPIIMQIEATSGKEICVTFLKKPLVQNCTMSL